MLRIQVLLQIVTPRTGNLLSGAIAPGLDQAIPVGVARELHSKQRCSLINRADIIFSYLNIVWLVYVASGDLDFLAESYPAMKMYALHRTFHACALSACSATSTCSIRRYIHYTSSLLDKDSGLLLTGNFGDWLAVFKVDNQLVSSSFFVRNLNTAAAAARALGLEADAETFESMRRAISAAFVKSWWNSTTLRFDTAHGFQASVALPLFAGICGSSLPINISQSCAQAIADITMQGECQVKRDSGDSTADPDCHHRMHITGGIMGAEALPPALSMAGHGDLALVVALQRDYPSWAAMTRDGSGSLWERWDGDLSDPEGSSRNHVMFSSLRTWAGVAVAGLSALSPGWSVALVAPDWRIVHSGLSNISTASCSVVAPAGVISTSWSSSSSGFSAERSVRVVASLPPTVSGIICVPCFDCSSAIITESAEIVWNGSSGFQPGVHGIRSAAIRNSNLLVNWSLAYPGAGESIAPDGHSLLSVCFDVDSGDYLFKSD
jgi:hypothetical protein